MSRKQLSDEQAKQLLRKVLRDPFEVYTPPSWEGLHVTKWYQYLGWEYPLWAFNPRHLGQIRHRSEVVEYRAEQHEDVLAERLTALLEDCRHLFPTDYCVTR